MLFSDSLFNSILSAAASLSILYRHHCSKDEARDGNRAKSETVHPGIFDGCVGRFVGRRGVFRRGATPTEFFEDLLSVPCVFTGPYVRLLYSPYDAVKIKG